MLLLLLLLLPLLLPLSLLLLPPLLLLLLRARAWAGCPAAWFCGTASGLAVAATTGFAERAQKCCPEDHTRMGTYSRGTSV
jgi:hypothetical protein